MNRKHLISAAIVVAMIAVFYAAATKSDSPHPPRAEWLVKHKITVERNGDPKRFCFKCHEARGETPQNFCNACHKKSGVKKFY